MSTGDFPPPSRASPRSQSPFEWPRDISPAESKSLIAGGFGWMLDAMDVMLYSFVLAYLMRDFGMSTGTAGLLNSLTLIASAIGGFFFGVLADRIGRTRALMASILVYSISSAACGFSHSIPQLAIFRFLLGLGMGGEWTAGAALIAETWRAEHRGRALGLMQSAYAIGEAVAAVVVLIVLPYFGWRAVFFVGVLPALLVFWIYRGVPEPELWKQRVKEKKPNIVEKLLQKDVLRNGIVATAMNACGMFGYWGLFTWIPGYLSLPVSKGGRGLSLVVGTTFYLVLSPGKWLGYASFGFFADAFGRRKPYFTYLLVAAILVPLYGILRSPILLLILGPFLAFFGTGFFSGYAAIVSEIFPGEIRAAAMGLSYNLGRGLSAAAPFAVGAIASRFGFLPGFFLLAAAFLAAALLALLLPETRGRQLT
ncbi:MAG TPA: MFS transporter [Candidatus Acidoferrum sp.]|jgi:MFS family permease|nr:MFS transporter [Candidatus Acidoferrum sp.]